MQAFIPKGPDLEGELALGNIPLLSVSQFTHAIKLQLESAFPLVYLQGEVSNFKVQSSGHWYFSLKDGQAQISAVMFRQEASRVKTPVKEGDQIVVKAQLSVYPPRGNYQLICRELTPIGAGKLLWELEQLKAKLSQKGYFAPERKRAIPKFPKRIGVITSPTGAVIRDIIHILTRRARGFSLLLYPVKVQGEGAAQEIAQAIADLNRYQLVDVIICGRGGGSIEDLWAFNEEIVATALFQSQIPTISAVGHETDTCIADWVADLRAPTPSAAAEIVSHEKNQKMKELATLEQRLLERVGKKVLERSLKLQALIKQPIFTSPYSLFSSPLQRLDDLRQAIDLKVNLKLQSKRHLISLRFEKANTLKPMSRILQSRQRLTSLLENGDRALKLALERKHLKVENLAQALQNMMRRQLSLLKKGFSAKDLWHKLDLKMQRQLLQKKEKKEQLAQLLASLDPQNILKKGYSIVFAEKGKRVISSIDELSEQKQLRLLMQDGEATFSIEQLTVKKNELK